jgi:hypothetical protein
MRLPGKPKHFRKNRDQIFTAVTERTTVPCCGLSHHQLDALLCAYTALCYGRGEVQCFASMSHR